MMPAAALSSMSSSLGDSRWMANTPAAPTAVQAPAAVLPSKPSQNGLVISASDMGAPR